MKGKITRAIAIAVLLVSVSVTPVLAASANYIYTIYSGVLRVASYAESFSESGYDRITIDNSIYENSSKKASNSADCIDDGSMTISSCSTNELIVMYDYTKSYESRSYHYFWLRYSIQKSHSLSDTL